MQPSGLAQTLRCECGKGEVENAVQGRGGAEEGGSAGATGER